MAVSAAAVTPAVTAAMEAAARTTAAEAAMATVEAAATAAPAVPTRAAAPTIAVPPRIAAPIPAGAGPAVVVPAIILAAEEELRLFDRRDLCEGRAGAKGAIGDGRLRYGTFTLDLHNHALWADGMTLSLTSIELAVMRELVKARGRPLSRTQLLDGSGKAVVEPSRPPLRDGALQSRAARG